MKQTTYYKKKQKEVKEIVKGKHILIKADGTIESNTPASL